MLYACAKISQGSRALVLIFMNKIFVIRNSLTKITKIFLLSIFQLYGSEVLIQSEIVGVAKVTNNYNDPVKGSLTRQKLHNSKVYTKSPEFSPALGLIIFGKKSVATNLR